jgi:hypothetical protein
MNLGELRKLTEGLSDDVEIITVCHNYELGNALVKATNVCLIKVKKEVKQFRDDFDGGRYSSEVYVCDENGEEVLKI